MSLYNMVHGYSPACVWIMPMLGHHEEYYPRFRDCYVEDGKIAIYTRVGGGNRGCGFGEEKLYKDPLFVRSYDDDFDRTYATYLFKVPDKWNGDFKKICAGKVDEISEEYLQYLREFWPKLNEKGVFDIKPSEARV